MDAVEFGFPAGRDDPALSKSEPEDFPNASDIIDVSIFEDYRQNRKVTETAFVSLVCCYACLILAGSIGNSLVICAVVRNPKMRSLRNFFILNLAISDLFLCLFTMPFTLLEIVSRYWLFGKVMCKFVGSMQAVSIFVSTMNITAIALDRYKVILYPAKTYNNPLGSISFLVGIWVVAAVLASPLTFSRTTNYHEFNTEKMVWKLEFCVEEWPTKYGRAVYSLFSMSFQYLLPILIVSVVYGKIGKRLKKRISDNLRKQSEAKIKKENERVRRTNLLFLSIGLVFGICWLPLNIYNLTLDFGGELYGSLDTQVLYVTFAFCHMFGMSSACLNPIFYGWLNNNFKEEFKDMCSVCVRSGRLRPPGAAGKRGNAHALHAVANPRQQYAPSCGGSDSRNPPRQWDHQNETYEGAHYGEDNNEELALLKSKAPPLATKGSSAPAT